MMLSVAAAAAVAAGQVYTCDRTQQKDKFWGLGGLSGGGATSVLLPQYKEPQRSQILDYLFKPNFGASLQILKVEIGGDSQSTDGTESSHMHSRDDLDVTRGYEWWLMKEAKKRNPAIKLYGLPWAFPGWVGDDPVTGKHSASPFTYPEQTANYTVNWVVGAKQVHGLDIDYLGVWNERSSSASYVQTLKKMLADKGFGHIQLVAKDGGADICTELAKDKAYNDAVDIIGLHYPSDYSDYSECHELGKPFWASEESSSYDDYNGAACWARVVNSHYVLSRMTSSIMWNLVGAYYHGTNWYASSLLTSVEPWSGNYNALEVVWATAHVTQFTQIGWQYLANGAGSGSLAKGGFYTTLVDPSGDDFTILVVKVSHDHASCTRPHLPNPKVAAEFETATFKLDGFNATSLAMWRSNYETNVTQQFEYYGEVKVVDGAVTVDVPVGEFITLSTIRTAAKGSFAAPPASEPFPLPLTQSFDAVADGQDAPLLADQIGAFEVHDKVLRQMVPELPIGWSDPGSNGPMTLVGMKEWRDISVEVSVRLPAQAAGGQVPAGCVATRVNQMWRQGVVLCYRLDGVWNVTYGGPPQSGSGSQQQAIASGTAKAVAPGEWFALKLVTVRTGFTAAFNGHTIATGTVNDADNGFAAIGANTWYHVEYDNLTVAAEGGEWHPTSPCGPAAAGAALYARDCVPNGVGTADEAFDLLSTWQLRHRASGLCAEAPAAGGALVLQGCDATKPTQQFRNDYTRVRNQAVRFTFGANDNLSLVANANSTVQAGRTTSAQWATWSYYPNTHQLRNQYDTNLKLGRPQCLSTCKP